MAKISGDLANLAREVDAPFALPWELVWEHIC